MDAHLQRFLIDIWDNPNPVFPEAFPKREGWGTAERLRWAEQHLGHVATAVATDLTTTIKKGMPEIGGEKAKQIAVREILTKTVAFQPTLIDGEVDDIDREAAATTATGIIYWGDQSMDIGDDWMIDAVWHLTADDAPTAAESKPVQARMAALRGVDERLRYISRPEDAPFVVPCGIEQILGNQLLMVELSRQYLNAADRPGFLAAKGARLAELSTVSAGFPSISNSLYAIYRRHDPSLPPLAEIYSNPAMVELLQVCGVFVRLLDDLGDWPTDRGADLTKGQLALNPFNQYSPSYIRRFCELAAITDEARIAGLQRDFAGFAKAPQQNGEYVVQVLRNHIREYVTSLPEDLQNRYAKYIVLCKRVLEIGYVNKVGDIALINQNVEV